MEVRLTLVRHAESTWNATGRWQGQSDVPLSPRGHLQARALATRLYSRVFDRRISSDLSRACVTAAALGASAEPDRRFREIDVGDWAGLKRSEAAERFPEQVRGLRRGAPVRIGGGESMPEFQARVDAAVDELRDEHGGQEVLLVTHGGVVRAIAGRVLGTRARTSPLVGVANTAMTVVRGQGDRLAIEVYNDALHLDPGDQDSSIHFLSGPMTRLAIVAAEPDPEVPVERALVDGILAGLGIAAFYAAEEVAAGALAQQLLAEPMPSPQIGGLLLDHEDGALAVVVPPERVPALTAELLELDDPEGLAVPPAGSVAQLRITSGRAELFGYGLRPEI